MGHSDEAMKSLDEIKNLNDAESTADAAELKQLTHVFQMDLQSRSGNALLSARLGELLLSEAPAAHRSALLIAVASSQCDLGRTETAAHYAHEALNLAEVNHDAVQMATARLELARIARKAGDPRDTLSHYEAAIRQLETDFQKHEVLFANIISEYSVNLIEARLGNVVSKSQYLKDKDLFERATGLQKAALRIHEKYDNRFDIAIDHSFLSTLTMFQNAQEAESHARKDLAITRDLMSRSDAGLRVRDHYCKAAANLAQILFDRIDPNAKDQNRPLLAELRDRQIRDRRVPVSRRSRNQRVPANKQSVGWPGAA